MIITRKLVLINGFNRSDRCLPCFKHMSDTIHVLQSYFKEYKHRKLERDKEKKKRSILKNKKKHQKTRIFETITELFACRSSARMSQLQQDSATSLGSGDIAYDAHSRYCTSANIQTSPFD